MMPAHMVTALAVPCPSCGAARGTDCTLIRPKRLRVHLARLVRGNASRESSDAFQHQRATAARSRLEAVTRHGRTRRERDVVSAMACNCSACPGNADLAAWLHGLGLLDVTAVDR